MNIATAKENPEAGTGAFQTSVSRPSKEELGSPVITSASDKDFILVGSMAATSRRSHSVDLGSITSESSKVFSPSAVSSSATGRDFQDRLHAWYNQNLSLDDDISAPPCRKRRPSSPGAAILAQESRDLQEN